mgnify:CR=1 FL=1
MSRLKIGLLVFLLILAAIQFIQPERNQSGRSTQPASIKTVLPVQSDVQFILQKSCYDCHSNNTHYPWYASLQPGAWWMASHIKDGKEELNFDEFASYSKRRQLSKLKAIGGAIEDESMPLPSYTIIHRNAVLSEKERQVLKDWIELSLDKISK